MDIAHINNSCYYYVITICLRYSTGTNSYILNFVTEVWVKGEGWRWLKVPWRSGWGYRREETQQKVFLPLGAPVGSSRTGPASSVHRTVAKEQ